MNLSFIRLSGRHLGVSLCPGLMELEPTSLPSDGKMGFILTEREWGKQWHSPGSPTGVRQDALIEWLLYTAPGTGYIAVSERGRGLALRELPFWFQADKDTKSRWQVPEKSGGAALANLGQSQGGLSKE